MLPKKNIKKKSFFNFSPLQQQQLAKKQRRSVAAPTRLHDVLIRRELSSSAFVIFNKCLYIVAFYVPLLYQFCDFIYFFLLD